MNANATTSQNAATTQEQQLVEFITRENASHQVTIWSKSYCPHCKATKELFKSNPDVNDIAIHDLDVIENGSLLQHYLKKVTESRTVPVVFVNNQYVGGNSDVQQLHQEGKLTKLLQKDPETSATVMSSKPIAASKSSKRSKECALEKTANKYLNEFLFKAEALVHRFD